MVSDTQDVHRLILMVLRLMDADILPPAEGNALLAAIEALTQTPEEAAAEGEADNREPLSQPPREAVVQTDRLDASPREQASESADEILHDAAEPY